MRCVCVIHAENNGEKVNKLQQFSSKRESLFHSRRKLATCCEHTRHKRRRRLCTCQFAVNYAYSRVKPDTKLSLPRPLSHSLSSCFCPASPCNRKQVHNDNRRQTPRCEMDVASKAKHCMRLVAKLVFSCHKAQPEQLISIYHGFYILYMHVR